MELLIFKVAIVLIVGYIGGRVARRYNLPSVSGYLLAGLILGPSMGLIFSGFGGVVNTSDQTTLKFISEIALAFIAFSIGAEFNLKQMKKESKKIITIANYEVLFAVLTVFVVLFFIPKPSPIMNGYQPFSSGNLAFGLVLAAMSAATAPAATLMVIKQYRAYGPVTKTILPVVALDDIHGIIIFGFFISIAQMLTSQTNMHIALMIAKPFIEVFGSLIIGAILGYILVYIVNRIKESIEDYQILAIIVVLGILGLAGVLNSYFSAYNLGISTLLANMMAGAMVANLTKRNEKVFKSVNNFTAPIYLIFFTLAGASLDLAIIRSGALISILTVAYILARGFGKYIGAYIGATIAKTEKSVRKYIGFALLPQGGISLGLLVIVTAQLPGMSTLISTIIMLSILVYETTGPIFAKFAISRAGEINGLDRLDQKIDISEEL